MSHDQKSCDIYKRFNWHKQLSTTFELQPHHTMRPLSVDKLNIVISRLHSGQTTCQISSFTGFSIGTISKIHSEHLSDLLSCQTLPSQCLSCSVMFYTSLSFSQFTKRTGTRYSIYNQWCSLNDRSEVYSKEYSCLANYGHMYACDNYYTKMYILSHLIK